MPQPQPQVKNINNLNYEDQDYTGFSLQLNQTQSDDQAFIAHPPRPYSHSMKYNDPSRIQHPPPGYPPQVVQQPVQHFPQHHTINENPFHQQNYTQYGRDSYSPDVNRRSSIEQPEFRKYSHTDQRYMGESWNGYAANQFQPQMYPSQMHQRQSEPERKMNLNMKSTIDKKSNSQCEEPDRKSSTNYDEVAGGYDINSPELIEKAYELAKDQAG